MNPKKNERIERERQAAQRRQQKALVSLSICLTRCQIMRAHHDALVNEAVAAGGIHVIEQSESKKSRFMVYVSYWFAALDSVIERYQSLTKAGTISRDPAVDGLLKKEMIDLIKPFRNAIAHCSDHDDARVLELLANPHTVPAWAESVENAFWAFLERSNKEDKGGPKP